MLQYQQLLQILYALERLFDILFYLFHEGANRRDLCIDSMRLLDQFGEVGSGGFEIQGGVRDGLLDLGSCMVLVVVSLERIAPLFSSTSNAALCSMVSRYLTAGHI